MNNFSSLDNFRLIYTYNFPNESLSTGEAVHHPIRRTGFKILGALPVISFGYAALYIWSLYADYKDLKQSTRVCIVSRIVFSIITPPLLIPIDLIGTLVKLVIDALDKRKQAQAALG